MTDLVGFTPDSCRLEKVRVRSCSKKKKYKITFVVVPKKFISLFFFLYFFLFHYTFHCYLAERKREKYVFPHSAEVVPVFFHFHFRCVKQCSSLFVCVISRDSKVHAIALIEYFHSSPVTEKTGRCQMMCVSDFECEYKAVAELLPFSSVFWYYRCRSPVTGFGMDICGGTCQPLLAKWKWEKLCPIYHASLHMTG